MKAKKANVERAEIFQAALGTLEHRRSYAPGMFEPLKPLFAELGCRAAAIYITDDYPDGMHLACTHGDADFFPPHISIDKKKTLYDECLRIVSGVPDLLTARLFSHGRELGAIAAVVRDGGDKDARAAFDALARSVSVMAYVERIRTNGRRERVERDIFFAHSLANRLLLRKPPEVKNLRLAFECVRSLEAGGEFLDLVPGKNGTLFGFIGSCNGKGMRTVLEVAGIMRAINRACYWSDGLPDIMRAVNDRLVREKRRAHQASLALFLADPPNRKLSVVKCGRVGMLLCGVNGADKDGTGKKETARDISASGSMFLGMADNPEIHQDEYDFLPGDALFCMTEGFAPCGGFRAAALLALCKKRRKPLANAIAGALQKTDDSLLALSAEFVASKNG